MSSHEAEMGKLLAVRAGLDPDVSFRVQDARTRGDVVKVELLVPMDVPSAEFAALMEEAEARASRPEEERRILFTALRHHKAVLTALNEHQDWHHDGTENSASCVGCSWVDAPTDIDQAPQKFREHQARMIILELDAP